MTKRLVAACGLLLPFALVAFADNYDKRTVVTLNEPVLVAGAETVTLEPGTYVFRLLNSQSNRNIVEIFNEDQDHLYTMILAIPNYRLDTETPDFRFWETPEGNPIALKAWFYDGDHWGQEFAYPQGLAAKVARETAPPVLAVPPVETEAELEEAPITAVTPAGEEHTVTAELERVPMDTLEDYPQVTVGSAVEYAPEEPEAPLPATASPYYLLAAVGMLTAAAGAGLELIRSR